MSSDGLKKGRQRVEMWAREEGTAMMNKRYLTAAVVAGLACLAPGAAQADLMWSLNGPLCPVCFTFSNDGENPHGTGAGTFSTFDTVITVWNLTTTSTPSFQGVTYCNDHCGEASAATADLRKLVFIESIAPNLIDQLSITFDFPLGQFSEEDPVAVVDELFVMNDEIVDERGCNTNCGGSATLVLGPAPVPEPSTASVLGAGLLGLVFLWRRRQQILGLVQ
jgi:hypothetical protein